MFGSTAYYAAAAAARGSAVDWCMPADKRFKATHRYDVCSTRGPMALTVPVGHLSGGRNWREVEISTHGQWWHVHRVTLESAYGRTPYFEFYIDRLLPLLQSPEEGGPQTVSEFNLRADSLIRPILDLPDALPADGIDPCNCLDLRRGGYERFEILPYWQLRADRFGFLPDLSILDLIFNTGPESALHIRRLRNPLS